MPNESGKCQSISWFLKYQGQEPLIGSVYLSINCEVNDVLQYRLNTWSLNGLCLVLGAFKYTYGRLEISWTELSRYSSGQKRVDAYVTCVIVRHMKEATRYDRDFESSLPDLMLAYYENDVTSQHYMPLLSKSDHDVLISDFHVKRLCQTKRLENKCTRYYTPGILSRSDNRTRISSFNQLGMYSDIHTQMLLHCTSIELYQEILETNHCCSVKRFAPFSARRKGYRRDLGCWVLTRQNLNIGKPEIFVLRPSASA